MLICLNLSSCDLYNLSCVNKKFNRWIKKLYNIKGSKLKLHNCLLLKTNKERSERNCLKLDLSEINTVYNAADLFIIAARNGNINICKKIIKIKPRAYKDDEAFIDAAANGHLDICKWLLKTNPNIEIDIDFALMVATDNCKVEITKWLLTIKKIGLDNLKNIFQKIIDH